MTVLTIVFADLTGSTGLFEALGNSRATEMVSRSTHWIGKLIQARGGRVIKYLGDGVLASFADNQAAVAGMVEMQRLHKDRTGAGAQTGGMQIKVGLARGDVIEQDGDELQILRHSLPYGTSAEHGLYFVAYGRDPAPFRRMLERMVIRDADGQYDRLLDFSRPVTGAESAKSLCGGGFKPMRISVAVSARYLPERRYHGTPAQRQESRYSRNAQKVSTSESGATCA